jgi:hypothetical protein
MTTQLKERPTFEQFKDYLKEAVARVTGLTAGDLDRWVNLGDEGIRSAILLQLKEKLEGEYGVELVWEERMAGADLTLESVAIQLHHVYSTVYLMERINSKIRNRNK